MSETTTLFDEMELILVMTTETNIAGTTGNEIILTDILSKDSDSLSQPVATE